MRAVQAPPGRYSWSGPSLLLEQPGAYPHEVLAGPFADVTRAARGRLPAGVKLQTWLIVYPTDPGGVRSPHDPSMPTLSGPEDGIRQLGEHLVAGGNTVDHRVVATAIDALH